MIIRIAMVPVWLVMGCVVAVGFVAGMVFDGLSAGFYFGREFLQSEAARD